MKSLKDGVISNVRAARVVEVDLLDTYESLVRSALADTALSARTRVSRENGRRGDERTRLLADHPAGLCRPARPPAAKRLDRLLDTLVGSAAATSPRPSVR